eukprot:gene15297-6511_t
MKHQLLIGAFFLVLFSETMVRGLLIRPPFAFNQVKTEYHENREIGDEDDCDSDDIQCLINKERADDVWARIEAKGSRRDIAEKLKHRIQEKLKRGRRSTASK